MEERGKNHPKLYSILKKLPLPDTTLLEQAIQSDLTTSRSQHSSSAIRATVNTTNYAQGGHSHVEFTTIARTELVAVPEAGIPKNMSLETMSPVIGPGTHATTLPGRKTTVPKVVKTKKWRRKKNGS